VRIKYELLRKTDTSLKKERYNNSSLVFISSWNRVVCSKLQRWDVALNSAIAKRKK